MKNKYLTIFLLVLLMILPSIFPDNESRYEEWSKSLLCPVCQGETIYDSPSEYADDMGAILLEQINNGMTDDEIYSFWVSRYGERIITNPINQNLEILIIPLVLISIFILLFVKKLYAKK
ncbi:MAG: hypothetical protein CMC86_06405 [Flavobacteriaceae bacterium]|nr:hypothetical protein [Flavobacteriaceae bacterium]|tara:strand:+ start:7554 stop:7913 length:360 start_codon:yes stop_codon:yes gene_type:complete